MSHFTHLWDNTINKSNGWLEALDRELGTDDPHLALTALRAVFHALRDRLPPNEAVELAAQMPLLLKGVYFDGWDPSATPMKTRTKEAFLDVVDGGLRGTTLAMSPERITRAVFGLIRARISEGETRDVRGILPRDVAELWEKSGYGVGR